MYIRLYLGRYQCSGKFYVMIHLYFVINCDACLLKAIVFYLKDNNNNNNNNLFISVNNSKKIISHDSNHLDRDRKKELAEANGLYLAYPVP